MNHVNARRESQLALALQIDELCDQFESAWLTGEAPRIEDYLLMVCEEARPAMLMELAPIALEYGRSRKNLTGLRVLEHSTPEEKAAEPRTPDTCGIASGDTQPTSIDESESKSSRCQQQLERLGRFELGVLLGQGAFGQVYKAYDPQLDRQVALKVLTSGLGDRSKIERFFQEAKAAARLRHPNIVPTYDSGQADGQYFIAAQFVSGQALSQKLKGTPPNFRQSADWVCQLAKALAYAHSEGIVHRDIKPDNIMLDDKGVPQIMDFGLAKRLNENSAMTIDGSILGTPAYMPPEQAKGELSRIGPHSDQYSLGVVLYELLTGKRPFQGTPHSVISQVISAEPLAPRRIDSKIPADLEAICQKSMSKGPAHRYSTIGEMAADLERWLRGEITVARPVTAIERFQRWRRRSPVVAGLIMAVILVTLAGIAGISISLGLALAKSQQLAIALSTLQRESAARAEAEDQAEQHALDTRLELAHAMISEARMIRRSQEVGQYEQAIAKLVAGRDIFRDLERQGRIVSAENWAELRNEAASASLITDLIVRSRWKNAKDKQRTDVVGDFSHRRYAHYVPGGTKVDLCQFGDDTPLFTIDGPGEIKPGYVEFTAEGSYLWLRSDSPRRTDIWDLRGESPTYLRSFAGGDYWSLSHDGSVYCLAKDSGESEFYRTSDGGLISKTTQGHIPWGAPLHPLRPWAAVADSQGTLRVFDYEAQQIIWEKPFPNDTVQNGSWSQNGRWLSITTNKGRVESLAAQTGERLHPPLVDKSGPWPIPLAKQNLLAVKDWDGALKLFDICTGRLVLKSYFITGERLHVGAGDSSRLPLSFFYADLLDTEPRRGHLIELAQDVGEISVLSNSGNCLAAGMSDGSTLFLHIPTGQRLATLPATTRPLAFESNDSSLLVYGAGGLRRIPMQWTNETTSCPELGAAQPMAIGPTSDYWGVSRNCDVVAAPALNEGIVIFRRSKEDRNIWTTIRTPPQPDVRQCEVSPDGQWVVAGGSHGDGKVSVYSTTTGQLVSDVYDARGDGHFSPDGRWLIANAYLFKVDGWRQVGKLPGPGVFTRDGQLLAVGTGFDNRRGSSTVQLLETATLRVIGELQVQDQSRVVPVAFTPTGTGLLARTVEEGRLLYIDLAGMRDDLKALDLDWNWPTSGDKNAADTPDPK